MYGLYFRSICFIVLMLCMRDFFCSCIRDMPLSVYCMLCLTQCVCIQTVRCQYVRNVTKAFHVHNNYTKQILVNVNRGLNVAVIVVLIEMQ